MSTTDHNSDSEVFEVKVTSVGAATLKRLTGFARWQLILGAVYSAFAVTRDFFSHWLFPPARYRKILPLSLEYSIRPVYGLVVSGVFVAQLIYYFRFVRRINQSLEALDSDALNRSFDNLYRVGVFFVFGITVNLLFLSLDFWGLLAILKMRG